MPSNILDHSMEILIPETDKHGSPVEAHIVTDIMAKEIARAFGGVRRRSEHAWWFNRKGKMTQENVIVLEASFGDDKLPQLVSIAMTFALLASGPLNQAELAMKVDGKLALVPADEWMVKNTTRLRKLAACGNGDGWVQSRQQGRQS